MSDILDLEAPANQTRFARLVGASQPSISKHVEKGRLPREGSYKDWFIAYGEHLRDEAAGRGGSSTEELTAARIDETRVKTANGRLDYLEKIKKLIPREDCGVVLKDWASYANREFGNAFKTLVSDVQAKYDIDIDVELVDKIAGSTTERIKDHAGKLAQSFSGSSD
jgi:citrate lyase gamma subunit